MITYRCPHLGCPHTQPCPAHRRSSARYGARWRRFRLAFLRGHHVDKQAHPEIPAALCVRCYLRGRTTTATDVDHVIPLPPDVRSDSDPRMFQGKFDGLDADCHREKTRED